ncbi:WbqC-like protein family protein [Rhizobiales bacterium GAS113]|nr:WbqC-like protein family protein [Rhizobiales bacterium GAS113]
MAMTSSGKRVAIIQSSYIPWKGYFDIVRAVDEFIFLDDAQFTRRDWRNRNRIKAPNGTIWLTIPVMSKGRYEQAIDETAIAEHWADRHWASIQMSYARASHFNALAPRLRALYEQAGAEPMLSRVNSLLIRGICDILGISTRITWSRDYPVEGTQTDRLLSICRAAGATHYLSGPSAQAYLEHDKFAAVGIAVSFADYAGYPEYSQLHGAFEHGVSILDLLFHVGPEAQRYMKRLLP